MVFQEDLPALYQAFNERLEKEGKKQKLITCQICRIEDIPSHSTNSSVCEMCFDDDFWRGMKEANEERTGMLWAIKTIDDGLVDGTYFAKGQYLGDGVSSVDNLSLAKFYQTKTFADEWIDQVKEAESKHRPEFLTVQVRLTEVG